MWLKSIIISASEIVIRLFLLVENTYIKEIDHFSMANVYYNVLNSWILLYSFKIDS